MTDDELDTIAARARARGKFGHGVDDIVALLAEVRRLQELVDLAGTGSELTMDHDDGGHSKRA